MRKGKKIFAGMLTAALAIQGVFPAAVLAAPASDSPKPIISLDFNDESYGTATPLKIGLSDYTGVVTYEEGRTGKAIKLDGYGLRLNQKNVGQNYTVSMWIKHDSVLKENQHILTLGHGNASSENWLDIGGDRGSNQTYQVWTRNTTSSTQISGWNYLDEDAKQITGEWTMLTVSGDGTEFSAYLDGQQLDLNGAGKTSATLANAANILNGDTQDIYIGTNNWDTAFSGLVDDVTVYDKTLTAEDIRAVYEQQYTEYVAEHLSIGELSSVTEDLTLPVSDVEGKVTITWTSDNPDILAGNGTVSRPEADEDAIIKLTAVLSYGSGKVTKEYTVVVKRADAAGDLEAAANALELCKVTAEDLTLPAAGTNGTAISWSSSDTAVMTNAGKIVSRPETGAGNAKVTLTATLEKGSETLEKAFEVEILEQYYGYIYGYITGDNDRTGSLHLAYSTDGETYTALNSNTGIHFAHIDTANGNKSLSTGIRFTGISLFRKANGTFGLAAPQGADQKSVYLYDSEDLLTYENEKLIVTNSDIGNVADVVIKYDAAINGYYLYWTSGDGQYVNVTTDLSTFGEAASAEYSVSEVSGILPEGAKNGSVIGVTKAEYEKIVNHFARVSYVSTDQPEDITVKTAADVEDALPDTVSVTYDDGSASAMNVKWDIDTPDFSKAGIYEVTGTLSSYENPLIEERADPQISYDEEGQCYYFTASYPAYGNVNAGYDRIILRKADTISGLSDAETEITIWKAPSSGQMAKHVWAPELHKINGKWYVFFAAGNSDNIWAIRPYVLVCQGDDPYNADNWKRADGTAEIHAATSEDSSCFDSMSLDMTHFTDEDAEGTIHHYVIWAELSPSSLYMQEINPEQPWAGTGEVIMLTAPEYGWERDSELVNEGPAILKHDGKIFCAFSASGTGPEYCIGLLYADEEADLMNLDSWTKLSYPILTSDDVPGEYGPGHNSFTVDTDGNPVFVYHARSEECYLDQCAWASSDPLYDPCRHARVKNVHWSQDGLPILNMSAEEELPESAGEVTVKVTVTEDSEVVRSLEDAVISGVEDVVETGGQICPKISVTWGSASLTEGQDYEVTYGENTKAGEASVTITAADGGRYTGNQTVTFTILPYLIADFDFDDMTDGLTGGNAVAAVAGGSIDLVEHDGGYAAKFTAGDRDWLNVAALNGGSLLTGYDEITISYDILPGASGTNWVFYAAPDDTALSWNANGNKERYLGVLVKNGTMEVERYNNTGSRPTNPSAGLSTSAWQHVDIVYTKDSTTIYLNGEEVNSVETTYQLTDILGDSSIFQIGKANWGSGEYSDMQLDNFRIVAGGLEEPEEPKELAIIKNPVDVKGISGSTAVFTVEAQGTGLTYQWQYCNVNSTTWRNSTMDGNQTTRITVPVAAYRDGQKYRCIVTDASGNFVISEYAAVILDTTNTAKIIQEPEDCIGTVGETAVFTVKAEGTGLSYQWQYSNAASGKWFDSSMKGSKTDTVTVPITKARDGQKYRCVITSESGDSLISGSAYLVVESEAGVPVIAEQPENCTVEAGNTATFTIQATGTNLTYQWQYSNITSNRWYDSSMKGNRTTTIHVPVTQARNGQKYRCIVTDETGRTVTSEAATLTVATEAK